MTSRPNVLISQKAIQDRVAELGRIISEAYPPTCPLILIGVLRGALYFISDLSRTISQPAIIDLISVSSYAGSNSTGKVTFHQKTHTNITGKDVLLIEDIVDTGRTIHALLQHFQKQNPRSIKICTLLNKPSRREVSVPIHYCGFRIPDHFVVGYGLDYDGYYRNLPDIGVICP